MDKVELLQRTKNFSLRVLKLVDELPKTAAGRAIASQLVRSATSIGANLPGRLPRKVWRGIRDETVYWLELILEGQLLSKLRVQPLFVEANEVTAIFTSARRTSSRNQTSNLKPQT